MVVFLMSLALSGSFMYQITKEANEQAAALLRDAIGHDSRFVAAYARLAWCHSLDALFGWTKSGSKSLSQAYEIARKAVQLDPDDPLANNSMAAVYLTRSRQDEAVSAARRALELDPNMSEAHGILGWALAMSGHLLPVLAISYLKKKVKPPLRGLPFAFNAGFLCSSISIGLIGILTKIVT